MSKIELRDVTFRYGEKGDGYCTLEHLNLHIEEGDFVCILGKSGCGKTTLLKLLAGLHTATEGQVLISGKPLKGPDIETAMMFQEYSLFPWMKVLENVSFGVRQAGRYRNAGHAKRFFLRSGSKKEADCIARNMLERVEMGHALDKYPYELSGGMKQRTALARALAMDAGLLLLDEPFGALDPETRGHLQKLLRSLWKESMPRKTVVMVTHDTHEAHLLGNKILYMSSDGSLAGLVENSDMDSE